jgi:N-acetylglutamate synthase-like GNAT family acetyltransferase
MPQKLTTALSPKIAGMLPYMSNDELSHEIDHGVVFWGYEEEGQLIGIMGIQDVKDVTLIRHAYVRTAKRNQGIGGKLLSEFSDGR